MLAELKHADWSTEHGLPMADLVAEELRRLDATGASGPVMVQSFEPTVLRDVRRCSARRVRRWSSWSTTTPWVTDGHPRGPP